MDKICDIFYIVKRLGAPLTQAFGALMGKKQISKYSPQFLNK